MIDQHDQDVRRLQRGVDIDQAGGGPGEFLGQFSGIGLNHGDPVAELAGQRHCDQPRRAFAEVVDVGLERQPKTRDAGLRVGFDQGFGLGDHVMDLAVVDAACGADQRGLFGRAVDDEPRVDRDAVAAHARTGGQDVDARMAVGQPDHFPHIQPHRVRHHRQLVGEGDVDVAVGVFDQLGHFRAAGIGGDAGAAHKPLVERQRLARTARGDPADRAIVVGQLFEDLARQDALRTIGDRDVGGFRRQAGALQVRAARGDQVAQVFGRADGRGRFEDHRVPGLQHFGDGFTGGKDIGNVGRMVGIERRRHGDDEHIGGRDFGRG